MTIHLKEVSNKNVRRALTFMLKQTSDMYGAYTGGPGQDDYADELNNCKTVVKELNKVFPLRCRKKK